MNTYQRRYATEEKYREELKARARKLRARNKAYWVEQLGGKCVDCGNADIRVLHFDHVGEKTCEVTSQMTRRNHLHPKLVEEISHCQLRCANCHLIKSVEKGELGRHRKYS